MEHALQVGITVDGALRGIILIAIAIPITLVFFRANKDSAFWQHFIHWVTQNYRAAISLLVAATIIGLIFCVLALRAFPNSGDEYVYLFQADTFLAGRLWNKLDPLHQYFSFFHIFEKNGKWVGNFPPGWPLLLAAGKFISIPSYAVSPICAVLLVLVAARLYGDVAGPLGGVIGTALLAISSFFLINGASYFSHIPTALFATLFVLYGLRYSDNPTISSGLIVGSTLGAAGMIRPYSAVLLVAPFAVELLVRKQYQFKMLAAIVIGVLPLVVALLGYNWAITGNPFLSVTSWGYPLFKLGFHSDNFLGPGANLLDTLVMAIKRLGDLGLWTSPLLVPLYFLALYKKTASRNFRFYDFIFPMFIAGYLILPSMGGNRYGPRYYFEAYPFLVLTIVSAITPYLMAKLEDIKANFLGIVLATLILSCVMIPINVYATHRIVNDRMQLYDAVRDAKLSNAVVILLARSGSISPMLEMDLTRNGINVRDADVIFALGRSDPAWRYATGQEPMEIDLKLAKLIQAFPGRDFYVFEKSGAAEQATLHKLAQSTLTN